MRATRRVAAISGLACLVLAGCNGGGVPQGPSEAGAPKTTAGPGAEAAGVPHAGDGQAPGAPQPGGAGGLAPGSPMHMPARTVDQGTPLDEKIAFIKSELTAQCGGRLCVKIVVEYSGSGRRCEYLGSDPEPGSTFRYRKNMTVKIFAGSEPCDDSSSGAGTSEGESPDTGSSTTEPGNQSTTEPTGEPTGESTTEPTGESTGEPTGEGPAGGVTDGGSP